MSSSKKHFLVIDEVKMRSKKSAGFSKRKNDKVIANDSILLWKYINMILTSQYST
jgi:hypothetical protein